MTMRYHERHGALAARPPGAAWLDDTDGGCRWCGELGSPLAADGAAVAAAVPTEPRPTAGPSVPPAARGRAEPPRVPLAPSPPVAQALGWIERTRVVMVPVAVITVVAALALVAMG
ncbi:hypothetical protein ACGFS9_17630 [Streptomyces sp. NPDC048566]|uniref:hypothetical protein n=1 Tax=Streptomyces sp. NPDC048566 TaxID=3365569 RepID=UPI0037169D48